MNQIKIGNHLIGNGKPCLIVAEVGFNHNGDVSLARKMVQSARQSGADAVKFQTFKAENLVSKNAKVYGVRDPKLPKYQVDLYRQYELSRAAYRSIVKMARTQGIIFFSTPFDEESADFLEELKVPAFKIASCDLTHHSLIKHVAKKGKPLLMSCGMSSFQEIAESIEIIHKTGNKKLVLLHCTSNYPCKYENVNLNRMVALQKEFKLPVGLSDHTDDNYASFAAAALGAVVIERHFTLNRKLKGVDQYFSLEPNHLADLVRGVRAIEQAKGKASRNILPCEKQTALLARRSLFSVRNIRKGEFLSSDMVAAKRPGTGISPKDLKKACSMKARVNIPSEKIITWGMLTS